MPKRSNIRIALALVVIILVVLAMRFFPVSAWLSRFTDWVADAGVPGVLAFVVVYVASCVLLLPGSILTLGAGFAFGLAWGMIAVSIGSTLGAGAAFLVARYVARDWVREKFARGPRFNAVDQAVARQGWKIVVLLRLSPLFPFNALNFLLGLTAIPFWHYLAASWIGMIPGTLLYVYLGYASRAGLESAAGDGTDALRFAYIAFGLLATLIVTVFVTRIARRALMQATESRPPR